MQVAVDTKRTSRFIDKWAYIALGATSFLLLALIGSGLFKKTLISKNISVGVGESTPPEKLTLKPQLVGALRIDVEVSIPTNTSLIYQIQLLDQQGKVVASAIKNAWSEAGTWNEEGESGSWSESDLLAGLDVRTKKAEQINLVITVLKYEGTTRRELTQPKPVFNVLVENGVVDTGPLFPALFATIPLTVMAMFAVPFTGKKVISKTFDDSDPSVRATLGGANKLIRVEVNVASYQTFPSQLQVKLVINDGYGEQVHSTLTTMSVNLEGENGSVKRGNGSSTLFFVFEKRDSYSFNVEVLLYRSAYGTIFVREGARTLRAQEVVYIKPNSVSTLDNIQDQNF